MFKSHNKDTREDSDKIDTGVSNDEIIVGGEDIDETTPTVSVPSEDEEFDTVNSQTDSSADATSVSDETVEDSPAEEAAPVESEPSVETIAVSTPEPEAPEVPVTSSSDEAESASETVGETAQSEVVDSTPASYDEELPADLKNILDWLDSGNGDKVLEKYREYKQSREKAARDRAELEEMLSQLK